MNLYVYFQDGNEGFKYSEAASGSCENYAETVSEVVGKMSTNEIREELVRREISILVNESTLLHFFLISSSYFAIFIYIGYI